MDNYTRSELKFKVFGHAVVERPVQQIPVLQTTMIETPLKTSGEDASKTTLKTSVEDASKTTLKTSGEDVSKSTLKTSVSEQSSSLKTSGEDKSTGIAKVSEIRTTGLKKSAIYYTKVSSPLVSSVLLHLLNSF